MALGPAVPVAVDPYFSRFYRRSFRFVDGHFCRAMGTCRLGSVAAVVDLYLIMVIVGFIIVLAHFPVTCSAAELRHLIAVNFPIAKIWFQIPLLDLI